MDADWKAGLVPASPQPQADSGGSWRDGLVPAVPAKPDTGPADSLAKHAPGMDGVKNPIDAFMAAWRMSPTGLVLSGGKPVDTTIPKNAGFFTGLADNIAESAGSMAGSIAPSIVGAVAGAAAGAETGPGAALTGVLGAAVVPQITRETMLDYYKSTHEGAPKTATDFIKMIATSAWNTAKGTAESLPMVGRGVPAASPFSTPSAAPEYVNRATEAHNQIEPHVPDKSDFAVQAYTVAPKAPNEVQPNLEKIYGQTGINPWQQTASAQSDPVLKQEILGKDVNGDPVLPKFNSMRPDEPEGTTPLKTPAEIAAHVDELLPVVGKLEGMRDDYISPTGAIGRYQIEPGTARQYGFDPSRLHEPAYNEMVARHILGDLSRRFNGDTEAVLVAYNAGPGRAMQFIRDGRDTSELPYETQGYLTRAGFGGKGGEPPPPPKEPPPPPEEGQPKSQEFLRAQAQADYESMLGEKGEPPKQTGTGVWRQMVSELESARGIDKINIEKGLLDPETQLTARDMFRNTYGSDGRSLYMIMKGQMDPITFGKKDGPSFVDVIQRMKDAGGNIPDFNLYRLAQRTIDLKDRGNVLGIFQGNDWVEKAQAVLDNPEYKKYEDINGYMQYWKRGVLEYGRDSGMFSQAQIDAMEAASSHVSIRRIMGDDAPFNVGPKSGKGFRVSNPLKRMEGSNRQIIDPILADIDNARQVVQMADRNRAIGYVLQSQEARKALGLKNVNVPGAEIAEPGSDVFEPYSMAPVTEGTKSNPFASLAGYSKNKGNAFTYYNAGKRETWTSDSPEIAELMRGVDDRISAITVSFMGKDVDLTKVLSFPAKLERGGIIGALDFPIRVFQKHALTAWALDPISPPPIITGVRGLAQAISKGETYWELMRHGGVAGSVSAADMEGITSQINKVLGDQYTLKETGFFDKAWNVAASPLHFMQQANEILATAERIGHYQRGISMGMDPTKVAMMGREYFLDFQERAVNAAARFLAQNVPFFKAEMLGMMVTRDGIMADARGFAKKAVFGIVGAQVAFYALNRMADQFISDPTKRYTSLPQYERDQFPFMTPPIGPNGYRVRLGSPYVIGPLLTVPVQRLLEQVSEKNPHAWDGWLQAMLADVTPNFIPAILRPVLEQATNHNFFTGHSLIPDSVKDNTADQQWTPGTSEVSKRISAILGDHATAAVTKPLNVANISPVVLDNYATEWTGTIGPMLLHALDTPLGHVFPPFDYASLPFVKSFLIRNPGMNSQQIDDFYKDAAKVTAQYKDASFEGKHGEGNQAIIDKSEVGVKNALALKIEHVLSMQRTALNAINANKNLSVDEKRQASDNLARQAWTLAVAGSKVLRAPMAAPQ